MTVNPHSLDLSAFAAEHQKRAEPDPLRSMLSSFIQALMSAEADAVCGAPVRGAAVPPGPTNARATEAGASTPVPAPCRWRSPSCERAPTSRTGCWSAAGARRGLWSRSCDELPARGLGRGDELPARGLDRRMERLVEQLGMTRLSKSPVSVMAGELDEQVGDFRSRPLDAGPYTFLVGVRSSTARRRVRLGLRRRPPGRRPRPRSLWCLSSIVL